MSVPRSLSEARAFEETQAASENEVRLKRETFQKFPQLSREANWVVIVRFIQADGSSLTEENIQAAVDVLTKAGSLAVLSDSDLQREQEEMATQIVANQFRRTLAADRAGKSQFGDFKSSEDGRLKMYEEIYKPRRFRQLMQTDREVVKELAAAESQRDQIVQKIMAHCYKAFDSAVIAGTQRDYDRHLAEERLMWLEKPIEELLTKSQSVDQSIGTPQRGSAEYEEWKAQTTAELRATDQQKHPERVGAIIPKTFEEARKRSQAIERSEAILHGDDKEVVITYSRKELLEMSRTEFREHFMKTNPQTGGWIYQSPAVEQAITDILNGNEPEAGKVRREYLRTHYVR